MTHMYLQDARTRIISFRKLLQAGRLAGVACFLLTCMSACSLTGFGGMTLDDPQALTVGAASGIVWWRTPVERGMKILEVEGGALGLWGKGPRKSHYNINARMTLGDPLGSKTVPYPVGGIGFLAGDPALNAGAGLLLGGIPVGHNRKLRLDYRYFRTFDGGDLHRVSLGVEAWGD